MFSKVVKRARAQSSLRMIFGAAIAVLGVVAFLAIAALVSLSARLDRTAALMHSSLEGVRLGQRAEVLLLLHNRTDDPVVRSQLEAEMRTDLWQAGSYVETGEEGTVLSTVRADTLDYFQFAEQQGRDSPAALKALEGAFRETDRLVAINEQQAGAAELSASHWDTAADVLGAVTVAMLVLSVPALLWWIARRAFRPVLALSQAMEAFANGDHAVRAEEAGAAELADMSQRFNGMADALARTRERQLAFIAGVAHDLRNPLNALSLSLGGVRTDGPLPDEDKLRQIIERVRRQVRRLERMVTDFLDSARVEAGRLDLHVETADVRDTVRQVVDLFGAAATAREIRVDLPPVPLLAKVDVGRLEQILANLLSNALKYSPATSPVSVSAALQGPEIRFAVVDHGRGMTEEEQRGLFEPFRRSSALKDEVPGVGIGLFVVRKLVEAHGGRLEVRSAPDQGSTFCVYLPAHGEPAPARLAAVP